MSNYFSELLQILINIYYKLFVIFHKTKRLLDCIGHIYNLQYALNRSSKYRISSHILHISRQFDELPVNALARCSDCQVCIWEKTTLTEF